MEAKLIINSVDFSPWVAENGIKYGEVYRNSRSVVTLDGTLYQTQVTKHSLDVALVELRDGDDGCAEGGNDQPRLCAVHHAGGGKPDADLLSYRTDRGGKNRPGRKHLLLGRELYSGGKIMQSTSALYKAIFAQEHTAEVKVNIAGVDYGEDVLVSMSTSGGLFADSALSIGGAVAKEINLTLWNITASIPKMAKIVPYYRLRAGQQVSEWVQRGVYYIDTRTAEGGLLTIHGYDDMLKAEQVWAPDQSLTFPMSMESAVTLVAELMGVPVDSRTQVGSYTIDYPANDYTLRDVLRYIAAASAGNWTMTDAGALRLVKVQPLPPEGAAPTVEIGQNASAVETAPPLDPISKVILLVDDENYYQAGADTGMTLEATCPYGTQQMANDILSAVNGYQYQPAQAAEALMDPAAELGDPMTVDDIYTVIAELATTFDALMAADVGAPGQDEIESEYPYQSKQAAEVDRKIAQTRSEIKKTSEEISAEIEAADGRISALELTVDGITLSVSQADRKRRPELCGDLPDCGPKHQQRLCAYRRQRGYQRNAVRPGAVCGPGRHRPAHRGQPGHIQAHPPLPGRGPGRRQLHTHTGTVHPIRHGKHGWNYRAGYRPNWRGAVLGSRYI